MEIEKTPLGGCYLIKPKIFSDERGFFFESYNAEKFTNLVGVSTNFVQDNQSSSTYGVIRGLHYQLAPYAQAKLVSVLQGEVLDVCVDIRKNSPTYGKSFSVFLNEENKFQLYIPRGFAHGFAVTSKHAVFQYKCDNYYNPKAERGIIYSDNTLNIDWQIPKEQVIISEKDKNHLPLNEAEHNFIF